MQYLRNWSRESVVRNDRRTDKPFLPRDGRRETSVTTVHENTSVERECGSNGDVDVPGGCRSLLSWSLSETSLLATVFSQGSGINQKTSGRLVFEGIKHVPRHCTIIVPDCLDAKGLA